MAAQNVSSSSVVQKPGKDNNQDIWTATFQRCKSQLSPKDLQNIVQIRSQDQLIESITELKRQYQSSKTIRALNIIEPVIQNLRSFTGVIDTAIQSNPEIASLCWGGLKLVIELSIRLTDALERIANGLVEIGQILPRLESYQTHLPHTVQLEKALAKVYEAVIGFCVDTIKLLQKHPIRTWLSSLWRNFDASLQKRLDRIQHQSSIAESESHVAKLILDQSRHEEIRKLLSIRPQVTMRVDLPCYSIPVLQNTEFLGRQEELDFCKTAIAPNNHSKGVLLHGTGGVGKTSIALELVYQEKSRRNIITWLAAEDECKLAEGFVRIALDLGLHEEGANAKSDRHAVKTWLEKTTDAWLIAFDNVEKANDLFDYLPNGGNGAYIITSRNPDISNGLSIPFNTLRIASFDPRDGAAFVLYQIYRSTTQDDKVQDAAEALSQQMGGLALGLKQMGGFIRETGCSIDDLLQSLRDKEEEGDLFADAESAATLGYPLNLSTAWSFSMSALDTTAKALLQLFALMSPDTIPAVVVGSMKEACASGKLNSVFHSKLASSRFLQSLRSLIRFGLVEKLRDDDSYTIHRIVQSVTLQTTDQQARNTIFNALVDLYLEKHPQSQATSDTLFPHWSVCALYAPHIRRLHTAIKEWKVVPESNEKLWILSFNCARYLLETGRMAQSLELIEDTEPYCDVSTRQGQIQLTYLENSRGIIALQHQKQVEARQWFSKAEAVRKKFLGDLDINTVAAQGNLALTLITERKWEDLIAFDEPRAELDAAGQLDHIPVRLRISIYNLLSLAYLETGRLDEAWAAIEKSTQLAADVIPVYSQLSGYIHFNRGNILKASVRLEEALREQLLSFDIRKTVLGDHIQTAGSCYRAAELMELSGRYGEALELLHESKRMYGNLGLIGNFSKGGEARSAWRIGKLLDSQNRSDEAEAYFSEAKLGLEALGRQREGELCEHDFNVLINYADS